MTSTRAPLDVGVIGCGTAGSAAALFLARAGHRVTVYERVPDPGPVGAGIVVQPTGLAVLARLGLAEAVLRRGARLDALYCETSGRRPVVDLSYAALSPALFGTGLHRGVLFEHLLAAVRREPIALRCGHPVEDLAHAGVGWVHMVAPDGRRYGPHELVVVADGARSSMRDDVDMGMRVEPYPWGALWFVGKDPERRFRSRLYQVLHGTRRMLGLLPTGLGPGAGDTPLVSLFWSLRADRLEAWRRDGLGPWKAEVLKYAPAADALLDQITDVGQMVFAAYHDVVMERWHSDHVVYLGDAAHATSPQLGQGCNLALYDAMTLADCLAEVPTLRAALAAYTDRRRDHLGFYQFATRWLTPFFQSDYAAMGLLRDAFMGLACRVPFVRREMVRSMAGIKSGLVYGSLPVSAVLPPAPPAPAP